MNNWKKISDIAYRFQVDLRTPDGTRLRKAKVIKFDQPPSKSELLEASAKFEETARSAHKDKELKPDGELDTARG